MIIAFSGYDAFLLLFYVKLFDGSHLQIMQLSTIFYHMYIWHVVEIFVGALSYCREDVVSKSANRFKRMTN